MPLCNSLLIHLIAFPKLLRANINRLRQPLCALIACGCVSLGAQENTVSKDPTNEPMALTNPQYAQMTELAATLNVEELVWQGDGEQGFISLYRPALKPSQMAILLMPDRLHSMAQHNLLSELYQALPEHGWSTYYLAMPAHVDNLIATTEQNSADGSTKDSFEASTENSANKSANKQTTTSHTEQRKEIALARIASSINYLTEKEIRAVAFVVENLNATIAVEAAIQQADTTSALVLWHVDAKQLDSDLLEKLLESRMSILDIVDHKLSPSDKKQRIRRFKLAGFDKDYKLVTAPHGNAGISHSQQRIRHWLEIGFQKYLNDPPN